MKLLGFRSKKGWKMGLATFGYGFILMVLAIAIIDPSSEEVSTEPETEVSNEQVKQSEDESTPVAKTVEPKEEMVSQEKAKPEEDVEQKEDSIPREYRSALTKAETYAKTMHMSKAGIYEQLTSEYGENFPVEAAQYAIDNIVWDWKENALKKAQIYAETMAMSDSAIYDQLISEYGEKFTPEEAQYAIDNLE